MKCLLIFYADFGGKGKGKRLQRMVEILPSAEIICRDKWSAMGALPSMIFRGLLLPSRFLSRGYQELWFDIVVSLLIIFNTYNYNNYKIFIVPGLRRINRCFINKGATVYIHGVFSLSPRVVFYGSSRRREQIRYYKSYEYSHFIVGNSKVIFEGLQDSRFLSCDVFDKPSIYQSDVLQGNRIAYFGGTDEMKGFKLIEGLNFVDKFGAQRAQSNISGWVNVSEKLVDYDIVCVPSYIDAEPRIIREALSVGCSVLVRASITVIRGPNVFVFDTDDDFLPTLQKIKGTSRLKTIYKFGSLETNILKIISNELVN
jgi:hypothetical protein